MSDSSSNNILEFLKEHPQVSSREIFEGIGEKPAYATVKRTLQDLLAEKRIVAKGRGKATRYELNQARDILESIDVEEYFKKDIDERDIRTIFNFELITELKNSVSVFTDAELKYLNILQEKFIENTASMPHEDFRNEFERLAIDLSWKSSQIEGNTYSLLETENLLRGYETAKGKTKDEATMLLNHKAALDFILNHPDYVQPLTLSSIEDIHSMLIKDLNVPRNIRTRRVGISGTNYVPIDNEFQIREALRDMCELINQKKSVFEKAFLALMLISYIQPFSDGNKRTSRIVSNAILISYQYCPISFRTVSSLEYKKAMLIFYEQNNLSAFKKIFIEQFEFAVKTYF